MSDAPIFEFDGGDPAMHRAYRDARRTFGYFWRECVWERHRIVPALGPCCVKAPFWDGKRSKPPTSDDHVEHMWITDVDFDGTTVSGTLLNSPNKLRTFDEGDEVSVPLTGISDWLYAIGDEAYGAYTVNLIRSRMGTKERREHDAMWGLKFGDPKSPATIPDDYPEDDEHPMSGNMARELPKELRKNLELLSHQDDRGWGMLHVHALAGNLAMVKALLKAGADPDAETPDGRTPTELARALNWRKVIAALAAA